MWIFRNPGTSKEPGVFICGVVETDHECKDWGICRHAKPHKSLGRQCVGMCKATGHKCVKYDPRKHKPGIFRRDILWQSEKRQNPKDPLARVRKNLASDTQLDIKFVSTVAVRAEVGGAYRVRVDVGQENLSWKTKVFHLVTPPTG